MYINTTTKQYPISQSQIKADNPHTSYPETFPCPAGYAVVFPSPTPDFDRITEYAREVAPVLTNGKYYQAYEVIALEPEQIAVNQAAQAAATLVAAKAQRAIDVAAIKVTTTSGKTFDGDEVAQTRMARAILALQATGTPATQWVLVDQVASVTVAELIEAMTLAGAEQTRLWMLPYA